MLDFIFETALLSLSLLARTVPMIAIGVVAAEFLVALGVVEKIAFLVRPFTRFTHLKDECGASFMMAFISPNAANAMLMDYFHRGVIGKGELAVSAMMNSFPSVVMHWRYLLPVYVPLLGVAGLLYFLLLMLVGFVKTGVVMIAGRLLLKNGGREDPVRTKEDSISKREALGIALGAAGKPLKRILTISVPTIIGIAVLITAGVFEYLAGLLGGLSGLFPVPIEGVGIIAAQFANYIAAAGVASTILAAGDMTVRGVVLTLLVGNVLSSFTRSLRWFGSSYVGIFGPKIGAQIMVLSLVLRNGIMLATIFILAAVWS